MTRAPAYRANGAPVSREAFYARACDPRRSVVVEACAGAGKTWMLVSRIVRALLDGALPQEILAITFTRKAAGEMRERLDDWLREFALPTTADAARIDALVARGVDPSDAPEWVGALAALQRRVLDGGRSVEIRTFHAWFAQLLRAAPHELLDEIGLDPDGELLQDLADHRAELMRRFHAALLGDAALKADHAALIVARGRSQAARWFDALLERRVEFELADRAGTIERSVAPAVRSGAPAPEAELASAAWRDDLKRLTEAMRAQGGKAAKQGELLTLALSQDDAPARHAGVRAALFTKEGEPRKLGEVPGLAAVQRALLVLAERQHQHESHLEHLRMVRLARVLVATYAAYKRERGLLDMNDLERGALALLRDAALAGWVQERLDARIRHVLIDEFQDTSPLQWHALHAWLSAYAGAGGGASGQRPPTLFVVGDPKQSIYRFRRAEPRVFEAVREFVVEALEGEVLECDHTRRNSPAIVDALNSVFEQAGRDGGFEGFRRHTSEVAVDGGPALLTLARQARPAKEADNGAEAVWRDSLTQPRREPDVERREAEARSVAAAIVLELESGVPPREIMVIARKRAPLRLLADALRRRHVPYVAVDDATLAESPEAQDLIAVLDALVSPQHRLSLARALRSPLFDASDDDLLALAKRAAHGGDWWSALMSGAEDSGPLARARTLLSAWQASVRQLPPHDLLDRIVAQGELHRRLAARVPAAQRDVALATVDAVLAQALALDGGRYATPYAFVRALRRRSLSVPAPDLGGAVRLLTVHGAKGLEADVVFVMDAQPERANPETAALLVEWPVQAEWPLRCAFVYSEDQCPADLVAPMADERRARAREELNALYVAMTRARRKLVFSATEAYRPSPAPDWWQRVAALAQPCSLAPNKLQPAPGEPPPVVVELPRWSQAPAQPPAPSRDDASPASRLGQAVHRALEWHARLGGEVADLAAGAALEFGAPRDVVAAIVTSILGSPTCRRFFDRSQLLWAGNEVPVGLDGSVLRIDRLVRLGPPTAPSWWVLDYKLQAGAAAEPQVREQLQSYCKAVMALAAGEPVRGAVITGDGELHIVI